MKRIISVLTAIILMSFGLCSCTSNEAGNASNNNSDSESNKKAESYTLYLGVHQDHDATEGKAKFASTFAAIICDEKGRIVDCVFDETENTVSLEGGAADTETDMRSKNEQGLEYSMKSASAIGKEWYEQANHFAQFLLGKTLEEDDDVDGGEAELMAGCTININGFKDAIDEADDQENSVSFESGTSPRVALAVVNNSDDSKNATAESDGVASLKSTYAAVAKADGKIVAANIEETETKVYFDHSGLIIELEKGEGKRDAGYSYAMKGASEIGLEWFEQVQNFEKYIVGLTPDEVAAIDMNGAYSADDALLAGCTIRISDFVKAVAKTAEK